MTPRTRAAVLTAVYYGAIFAAMGAHLPYWPVWLAHWGLSEAEIGLFLGAATVARIVGTTVLPALADRFAIRRWIIVGASLTSSVLLLAHLAIETQGMLLTATLVLALVMTPPIPIGEALGVRASTRFGFSYAPVRAAGSATFLAANVGVGMVLGSYGPDVVVWIVAAGFLATAAAGIVHPGGGAAPGAGSDRTDLREVLRLALVPAFVLFGLSTALGQASHAVFYAYSVLHWQALGISDLTIGWLWAFGVLAETVLMLAGGQILVQRLGPARAILIGSAAAVFRWTMMAFEPGVAWLWPLQALHALTFALAHLGAMAFLAEAISPRMAASAQGLRSGIVGGLLHAATLAAAAPLVSTYGIAAAYWLAVGLAVASVILAFSLASVWHGGRVA